MSLRANLRVYVAAILMLAAMVHAMPVLGVLGVERLATLYGVQVINHDIARVVRVDHVVLGMLAVGGILLWFSKDP
jgi:hypothetical protein